MTMKKNIILTIYFLWSITVAWSLGTEEISEEEQRWMEEYNYEVVALVEDMEIKSDKREYEFTIVPRKSSSRYRVAFHFPEIDSSNRNNVIKNTYRMEFTEDFNFIIKDIQTGEQIAEYDDLPFQYGRYKDNSLYWDLFSLKLKKNREYKLNITIPGIEDVDSRLRNFRLLCYIAPRPFL